MTGIFVNIVWIYPSKSGITHFSPFSFCKYVVRMIKKARSTHNFKSPLFFEIFFIGIGSAEAEIMAFSHAFAFCQDLCSNLILGTPGGFGAPKWVKSTSVPDKQLMYSIWITKVYVHLSCGQLLERFSIIFYTTCGQYECLYKGVKSSRKTFKNVPSTQSLF